MQSEIVVALITGGLSLLGVIISNRSTAKEIDHKITIQQAVTETKLEELTREAELLTVQLRLMRERVRLMRRYC